MGLIYLDSCLLIYTVERHSTFGAMVEQALAAHSSDTFAISALVRLECLVGPLKAGDDVLATAYRRAFTTLVSLPVSDTVFDDATQLRAAHGLRTPDALHLAAARRGGCTALWTNDGRFSRAASGFAVDIATLTSRASSTEPDTATGP